MANGGYSLVAVFMLLTVVASLVIEHGFRCGLMDANCNRLTEPLYKSITAVDKNMFRATLIDYYSEVILNAKGVVMK